jgi:carbon-monoxide dehydrogenase large subunit/6-hydroxypseudooxynicotine dehydrogenase subunit gamma
MVEAMIVRSPHAHARIKKIDASAACTAAGVIAVVSYDDLPKTIKPIPCRIKSHGDVTPFLQSVLAKDVVRYVGEPIAVVIAETRALAEDAAELVEIEWETLSAVTNVHEAAASSAGTQVDERGNIATDWSIDLGSVDDALRSASVKVTHKFKTGRQTGLPLETRGVLASYDVGRHALEVFGPTKIPHTNRRMLAEMLSFPESEIRFLEPDVGGSFGVRGEFYPEDFLVPWLAIRLGRPVRWIEDRFEHFSAINHSRQAEFEVTAAADVNGFITAFELNLMADLGAYMRTHGDIVPSYIAAGFPGPYRVRNYRAKASAFLTNKSPTGTMRCPGTFESNFVRERVVDMLADKLGMDRVELRLKNLIRPTDLPWKVGTIGGGHPTVYDSGDFPEIFKRALDEFRWGATTPSDGRTGRGISLSVEPSALGVFESARIEVGTDGFVRILTGCTSQGQGQETSLAQVAAETLTIPIDRIRVIHGDTGQIAYGGGTNASRAAVMAGNAVHAAALEVKQKAISTTARRLECAESDLILRDGRVEIAGAPGSGLLLGEVAKLLLPGDQQLLPSLEDKIQPDHSGLMATNIVRGVPSGTSVFAVHLAEIEADRDLGLIQVKRLLVAADVGRAINPMIVEGQIVGGAVQGVGYALLEEIGYDEEGQLQTATLADYLVPGSYDAPQAKAVVIEQAASPSNPLGVKGVGEVGPTGIGAAIGNAVADALKLQNGIDELPITPERVLAALGSLAQ